MQIRMIAVIAGMALAMPCIAQQGGAPSGGSGGGSSANTVTLKVDGLFNEIDTNKDGKISKEEWKAAGLLEMIFSKINASNSGSITLQELASTKLPETMDANKDGILSLEEWKAFDKTITGGGSGGGGAQGGGGQK
jgi:hypothetical protein